MVLCVLNKSRLQTHFMFSATYLKKSKKKLIPSNKGFSDYLQHAANNTLYIISNAREVEQKL